MVIPQEAAWGLLLLWSAVVTLSPDRSKPKGSIVWQRGWVKTSWGRGMQDEGGKEGGRLSVADSGRGRHHMSAHTDTHDARRRVPAQRSCGMACGARFEAAACSILTLPLFRTQKYCAKHSAFRRSLELSSKTHC